MSEVKKLLPVFNKTVDMLVNCGYRDYKFVIPTVETTEKYVCEHIKTWKTKPELVGSDERYQLYANTYIAIVASGTVSAELAIMHIPTLVVYKMNPLTVLLARMILRVKWASLVNILMNKAVFPELLGRDANAPAITDAFQQLTLPHVRKSMLQELKLADKKWNPCKQKPAAVIAKDILSSIN
jgi:lipid-A-disaccharide synthase